MRFLLYASLIGYTAVYIWLVLLHRSPFPEPQLLLTPLWSYREAFSLGDNALVQRLSLARQILLNILVYMPLGLLLPRLLEHRKHPLLLTLLCGFGLSVLTEVIQYFTRLGYAEVDDLINNTLGCLLGIGAYCLGVWLLRLWWNRHRPEAAPD